MLSLPATAWRPKADAWTAAFFAGAGGADAAGAGGACVAGGADCADGRAKADAAAAPVDPLDGKLAGAEPLGASAAACGTGAEAGAGVDELLCGVMDCAEL